MTHRTATTRSQVSCPRSKTLQNKKLLILDHRRCPCSCKKTYRAITCVLCAAFLHNNIFQCCRTIWRPGCSCWSLVHISVCVSMSVCLCISFYTVLLQGALSIHPHIKIQGGPRRVLLKPNLLLSCPTPSLTPLPRVR